MHINIRYKKKRKISKALQERVHKKMEYVGQYLEEDHPVHFSLSSEKDGEHAEISFHYRGHDIYAKAKGKNLFESIDSAVENTTRQVEKLLEKAKNHKGEISIKNLPGSTDSTLS